MTTTLMFPNRTHLRTKEKLAVRELTKSQMNKVHIENQWITGVGIGSIVAGYVATPVVGLMHYGVMLLTNPYYSLTAGVIALALAAPTYSFIKLRSGKVKEAGKAFAIADKAWRDSMSPRHIEYANQCPPKLTAKIRQVDDAMKAGIADADVNVDKWDRLIEELLTATELYLDLDNEQHSDASASSQQFMLLLEELHRLATELSNEQSETALDNFRLASASKLAAGKKNQLRNNQYAKELS